MCTQVIAFLSQRADICLSAMSSSSVEVKVPLAHGAGQCIVLCILLQQLLFAATSKNKKNYKILEMYLLEEN